MEHDPPPALMLQPIRFPKVNCWFQGKKEIPLPNRLALHGPLVCHSPLHCQGSLFAGDILPSIYIFVTTSRVTGSLFLKGRDPSRHLSTGLTSNILFQDVTHMSHPLAEALERDGLICNCCILDIYSQQPDFQVRTEAVPSALAQVSPAHLSAEALG